MHNIDRTGYEMGYEDEYGSGESEYGYESEFGYEGEEEDEFYGETSGESPFNEAEEMELAMELLNVSNEEELEQFIGKLFKKAGRAIGKFAKSSIGRQLGGIVKGAVKTALPMVGGALGNLVLPGVGGAIGGKLASAAGGMLGLELEGLSQEDQEFEIARQLVRFGGAAASNAAQTPPTTPAQQAAQTAAVAAAQQYAPGLLNPNANAAGQGKQGKGRCNHRRSGQWIRKGNRIIIIGA